MVQPTQSRLVRETGITQVDDAALVTAYLELEDAASFSELIRRHQIAVYRLLTALLANPDAAEPACEEVFVRAAHRLADFDRTADFGAWVADIVREVVDEQDAAADPPPDPLALDDTLAAAAGRGAMRGAVRRALAELPPEQRSVLLLVELHGEPLDRAAATLGIRPSEARAHLEAARNRFAESFRKPGPSARAPKATPADATQAAAATLSCEGYELLDVLGEGGMGRVVRARHEATGEHRAIKFLLPELVDSSATQARFRREATIGQQLHHPHIVEVFEFGQTRSRALYMVMEYLDGRSLEDLIGRGAALPLPRALGIMKHVLQALGYLHEREVVHRDIKPGNIMLVIKGANVDYAKLLDLGIARVPSRIAAAQGDQRLTGAGMTLGTPAYISPEQALGSPLDGRADLYSATVMLFEMLTGRLPFEAEDAGAMLAKHVSMRPPRLRHRGIKATRELELLLARGLAKQTYDRFADAAEYLEAIQALEAAPD